MGDFLTDVLEAVVEVVFDILEHKLYIKRKRKEKGCKQQENEKSSSKEG